MYAIDALFSSYHHRESSNDEIEEGWMICIIVNLTFVVGKNVRIYLTQKFNKPNFQ